jgi:nucleotide-binding universal stress UspA family protein
MDRILVAIDPSLYATSVVDHAAWVAQRMDATVELLHVIQRIDAVAARGDHSGALGLAAKSGLMEELVRIGEAEGRLARKQGQALLEAAEARLREAGITDIIVTHRHGGVIETIIEREADADLVVIGKRGEQLDFARGHIGSIVERVVRESVRPVLVASRAFEEPRHAVIAFDGGPSARKAVSFLASHRLLDDVALHLVMAGSIDEAHRRHLEWARSMLPEAVVHEMPGTPADVVQEQVARTGARLLVMGAYGHSPLRSFIIGSTTTALMRACPVPVLLFR